MTRRMKAPTVSHRPGGWPDEFWPGQVNPCREALKGGCTHRAEWRVDVRQHGYLTTGYYCTRHRPRQRRA